MTKTYLLSDILKIIGQDTVGAMTFGVMTFGAITFGAMTFGAYSQFQSDKIISLNNQIQETKMKQMLDEREKRTCGYWDLWRKRLWKNHLT